MLRALVEAGIAPDLVVGTSVGAVNGALIAGDPSEATVARLAELWSGIDRSAVFGGSVITRLSNLAKTRTSLHDHSALRALLDGALPGRRIEDLAVPFQCVAASIQRAAEHWFDNGPVTEAVLASASVPGLLPPMEIEGEHFVDGGIVNSIPVGRAVALGARRIYVLQVGRIEAPLRPPSWPWEVGLVAFEISRRHRFAEDMASLPQGVEVHVLPAGEGNVPRFSDLSQLRYRDFSDSAKRIERAYGASRQYLADAQAG